MAFVSVPGLRGKVYVPEDSPGRPQKHCCKDCFACQQCGDDRCQLCLRRERDNGSLDCPCASTCGSN